MHIFPTIVRQGEGLLRIGKRRTRETTGLGPPWSVHVIVLAFGLFRILAGDLTLPAPVAADVGDATPVGAATADASAGVSV